MKTPIRMSAGAVLTVAGEELYNPFREPILLYLADCPTCAGLHVQECSACKGEGCEACHDSGEEPCPTCNPDGEILSAAVHGRGLPGFPEPTLCGGVGPVPHVMGEITCPRCKRITGDPHALARRANALSEQYGAPTSARAREDARC